MTDNNLICKHSQQIKCEIESMSFCSKCGCILVKRYKKDKSRDTDSFAVIPSKMMGPLDISPYDSIKSVIRQVELTDLSSGFEKFPDEYHLTRKRLISMLKSYIIEHNFNTRSFFLGVYILDYIFANNSYSEITNKLKLDLLILGIFLVAVKFIDDDAYPPALDSFTNKSNNTLLYSLSEVRKYECIVVKLMNFKLDIYTSYFLTETILSHGIVLNTEFTQLGINDTKQIKDKLKKLYRLSLDINKLFLEDISFLKFSQLQIAATSILMAKELMKFDKGWSDELENLYMIPKSSLAKCYSSILK